MAHPYPGVLTPQQEKVVKLLADGLTYPQIGARMHLSKDGVIRHVRRACERVGLAGTHRAALVHEAWWLGGIGDRPELLAEIERLTAEVEKLRADSSDHRTP